MTVAEKIQESHYWLSGEPFTVEEMRRAIKKSAPAVQTALRSLDEQVSKTTHHSNNGSKTFYRRRTLSTEYLRKPWVSEWAMEQGRGYLPR